MDFDFLPNLPKANLDDRAFEDLVEECLLRIPRYCPEWTNHNPSDPGITMVELFAWLTDQMLLRFNQVPRRNYVTFLELLGIRLNAPRPAQVDVTFYLSSALAETYTIAADVEVATLRTDTEEAVVFSTDATLPIGVPQIRHLLTAEVVEPEPQLLRDRLSGFWTMRPDGKWEGLELNLFEEQPQEDNCFYVVFEPNAPIAGNVIALTVSGDAATSTGINPEMPPRHWEAWNGKSWVPILLAETDDHTEGFSFSELSRNGGNSLQGADIILHCPKTWPNQTFGTYHGRWVRCTYKCSRPDQPGYTNTPQIVGLRCRAIGGTVGVTQAVRITNEILGESNGQPGQRFQLESAPVLPRREEEYLLVTPPGALPQAWQEVSDFANSTVNDLHYTLDSFTGEVQLGPLVQEPGELLGQTEQWQRTRELNTPASEAIVTLTPNRGERQYGAVPPRGASLMMVAYRTGGGQQGNVQQDTIRIVKSAVPYVARVTNHQAARNGADAESLDSAVLRVPKMLRTRERAVTMEDFETLALQAGQGAIARAKCLPTQRKEDAGIVDLVLVPQMPRLTLAQHQGVAPDDLRITPALKESVLNYLDNRRLLGVEVRCQEPDYVGVSVQTEVALEPEYRDPAAQQQILATLEAHLYRFLNPITGGLDGQGWPFGRPVYASDIVTLFQAVRGVRYLGAVQLFALRKQQETWTRTLATEPRIDPGALGLICSWRDSDIRATHVISLI
ncbi:MAG: putative baseplate assembly protein [Spirulina sp. SIO3F2]|nr:putative baseplate assembly protein [Spirulina sp. SIO3F2]